MNKTHTAKGNTEKPTIPERLYAAGQASLAAASGPLAGMVGCAAMYAGAYALAKFSGDGSFHSLQGLEGTASAVVGMLAGAMAVGAACVGALKGYLGKIPETAASLSESLMGAGRVLEVGLIGAVATTGAIAGMHALSSVYMATTNAPLAVACAVGMIATGSLAIAGSAGVPLLNAMNGGAMVDRALGGEATPSVDGIAKKLRERKEHAEPTLAAPKLAAP